MTNELSDRIRIQFRVRGIVQGVGFRPFVYRLASELGLTGQVGNDSKGVWIDIQGRREAVDSFAGRLLSEAPPLSRITDLTATEQQLQQDSDFRIDLSHRGDGPATLISPDIATCPDCRRELLDPGDRRYRYPFINCTNCGPRFSIIERLPYDREATSMRAFPMCPVCAAEYHEPRDRRFHAQPNACWTCGPQVTLWRGETELARGDVIAQLTEIIKDGQIVAIRGLGGFHLAVDATNERAVKELRNRKHRVGKPFALMARSMEIITRYAELSAEEERLLTSSRAPIVLLKRKPQTALAASVAETSPYLGFMLPYTPLQHLLFAEFETPLVMTSGNLSEEPIAIGNDEARERLKDLADYFVFHDREILQRSDDSIVIVSSRGPQVIRRARSYAPEPILLSHPVSRPILAVGGELKNCVALAKDNTVFLSQHIGDLSSPSALAFFDHAVAHLQQLLGVTPELIVCDLHPDYQATRWALQQNLPVVQVQHHHAHLASVLAERGISESTVGIILDGTGFGTDETIWGGEILYGAAESFERKAWLRPFRLPGGDMAIRQPWRIGISLLREAFGESWHSLPLPIVQRMSEKEKANLHTMLLREFNSPLTSSCGRLFDGVAALLGFVDEISFEAEAAIWLECLAGDSRKDYDALVSGQLAHEGAIDFRPLVRHVVERFAAGDAKEDLARSFHIGLAGLLCDAAVRLANEKKSRCIALSGGVFQNMLLFQLVADRLERDGIPVLTHREVPANDGGISLGQVIIGDAWFRKNNLQL